MQSGDQLDRFHTRKHPRLKRYDYSQPGYYFVTICTHEKRCIFGGPVPLGDLGKIALLAFDKIEMHFPGIRVDKCVVMPNHVHAIIEVTKKTANLPLAIGHYKAYVTKQIHASRRDLTVWQTSFHDHIIRNQQDYQRIWGYIDANPANWQKDCFYCV